MDKIWQRGVISTSKRMAECVLPTPGGRAEEDDVLLALHEAELVVARRSSMGAAGFEPATSCL